ncbi:hypothetical protein JHK82_055480 [Glycine max]|uniref:RRM domain-containing protein n=1 Tax=Glycine max TaxID=3847 RepID=K7N1V1_SOYBN|nr:hypothetical protein JHK86_055311 [Glycine max]KAG4918035.1 hypothetical protein JHK85_056316 [Glycine max]KAG5074115.1 hypothetical protein JHK84_055346 [Glycine max]KAG5076785.1 hypothetical protein JHK82_055480 [Glycine max]KAH1034764.1 hypothetical protein GYH30_054948 [Glycine max]
MNMTFCLIIVIPIIGQDKKREISRERVSRERNTGWGRDRVRGKRVWRDRASLGEVSRRHYAGNIGRAKLTHSVTNWRDHKDITFFYFSRFADDITEKELWYHFKKWGDVREIFIPKRRNFTGRRYGFVRFIGVHDIPYLAKQLDRIVIGGLKLFVNLPKYDRGAQKEEAATTQTRACTVRKQRAEFQNQHMKPTSYADALTRNIRRPGNQKISNTLVNHKTSSSSVLIEVKLEDTSWLKEAWVGRLKNPTMFERLEEELLWGNGMDVTPRYMGDDQVLLLGLTDTEADQLMSGGSAGGTRVFSSIERWNLSLRAGCRLTWIQCWGIPIQAWNPKYINQIVAVMGELVDLDDSVEEKRRLDRARILIKTPWRPLIQHTVEVVIEHEKFMVHVVEECCGGYQDCIRRGRSVRGSSEEINSDDSFLDSSSHINRDLAEYVPHLSESKARGVLGVKTKSSVGVDDQGVPQLPHSPETELRLARHEVVAMVVAGVEDHEISRLPTGHNDCHYPLDNDINPRINGGNQSTSLHGPNLNSTLQVSAINNTVGIAKKGVRQWVSLLNRDAASQNFHQNGNEGTGESNGLEKGQKAYGAEDSDVALVEDSLVTHGNFEYKKVEGPNYEEAAHTTIQDQDISNCTPKDKRSTLGLNPQARGVKTLGRFIPGREGATRNQIWAFFHLFQELYHILETHNLNTQTFRHCKGKHIRLFRTFPLSHRSAMESQRQS